MLNRAAIAGFAAALLAASLAFGGAVHAEAVRTLDWDSLLPKLAPFDDPFEKLSSDQYYQMGTVAIARDQKTLGLPATGTLAERARAAEAKLRKEGIDVEGLLSRREEVRLERERRGKAVNTALDGKPVRMPGFVLPLEFTGRKVREFLLVPWVGACIHTPPPPPNQIVHVKMAKGAEFESKGMYAAVWVSGTMHAKASKPTLNLVDGIADIDAGYTLTARSIEEYRK